MTILYQKLNVPNLKELQEEVLDYIKKNNVPLDNSPQEGGYSYSVSLDDFPKYKSFLLSRLNTTVEYLNLVFLPGHEYFPTHIDGDRKIHNQVVINFPVSNYDDAVLYYYNNDDVSPEDEIISFCKNDKPPYGGYSISRVRPGLKLIPIDQFTCDNITLMRSDVYHDVTNHGPNLRIMVVTRCKEWKEFHEFSDIINYEDLI